MMIAVGALVVLTALFELPDVEAKYCPSEVYGVPKYKCNDHEYCCNLGCCFSPAFHFYQLWYYWLLVIFMFLLCSGGGWWYRYWLQSRYRDRPVSSLPRGPLAGHVHQPRAAVGTCNGQVRRTGRASRMARVSYNPARDTVVLHRIWKGPRATIHRSSPPPSYTTTQNNLQIAEMSSVEPSHQQTSYDFPANIPPYAPFHASHSPVTNLQNSSRECPYYQLYGPPPSYESVVSDQTQQLSTLVQHPKDVDRSGIAGSSTVSNNLPTIVATTNPVLNPSISRVKTFNETNSDEPTGALVDSRIFPSTSNGNAISCDPEQMSVCNPHITVVESAENIEQAAENDGVQVVQTTRFPHHPC